MRTLLRLTALSLAACAACVPVMAAEPAPPPKKERELLQPPRREIASPLTDHFSLRGAYYGPDVHTTLRVDSTTGFTGTQLDGERDLGLDNRVDQGTLEMILRMRERNRLRVDFFKLARHGDQVLERGIDFGDDRYFIGDRLVSDLDWRMLGLTYTFSFVKLDWLELSAGLGVHLIEAQARGAVPARSIRQDYELAAPFPTLAIDGTWRISSRWALSARAQRFNANVDDFDGALAIYHADVQYRWRRNLAMGVGFTTVHIDLESSDTSFPGLFALHVKGPEAFVRVSF